MFIAVLIALLFVANWTAPPLAEAFYAGELADGRTLQLQISDKGQCAELRVEGAAYRVTLGLAINNAGYAEYKAAADYGGSPRWIITGFTVPSGAGTGTTGTLFTMSNSNGLAFTLARIAQAERWSSKRGLQLGGRGGSKAFTARWPRFQDGVPAHEALSHRLAAELKDTGARCVRGAFEPLWEGLKEGGENWNWESARQLEVVWAGANAVSLCERHYEFAGGPHGNSYHVGRNFLLAGGRAREFEMAELFAPDSDWTNVLSTICLRELRLQGAAWTLPDTSDVTAVSGFTAEDLQSFNVDRQGLIIHFPLYSVAPYCDGLFEVFIPWTELESILGPEGPL